MITIEKARKLIGKKAEDMDDDEVQKIIDDLRSLAEIIFEQWLKERKKKVK